MGDFVNTGVKDFDLSVGALMTISGMSFPSLLHGG
jgi:hypothetical protein